MQTSDSADAPQTGSMAIQHIYKRVRAAIVSGEFPPGVHLREVQIAERYGVSRTPVREAFRQLEVEGFLEVVPHLGVRVVQWTTKDLADAYEVRLILEPQAALHAAARLSLAQIEQLQRLADQIAHCSEKSLTSKPALEERCRLNGQFHENILAAAGNPRLHKITSGIMSFPLIVRNFGHLNAAEVARSDQHHVEMVAAFRARDAEWAAAVTRSHILQSKTAILRA